MKQTFEAWMQTIDQTTLQDLAEVLTTKKGPDVMRFANCHYHITNELINILKDEIHDVTGLPRGLYELNRRPEKDAFQDSVDNVWNVLRFAVPCADQAITNHQTKIHAEIDTMDLDDDAKFSRQMKAIKENLFAKIRSIPDCASLNPSVAYCLVSPFSAATTIHDNLESMEVSGLTDLRSHLLQTELLIPDHLVRDAA